MSLFELNMAGKGTTSMGHLSPLAKEMISQQAMENIDTLNLFTITVAEKAHCKDIALFGDDISVDGCDHCDCCGSK